MGRLSVSVLVVQLAVVRRRLEVPLLLLLEPIFLFLPTVEPLLAQVG